MITSSNYMIELASKPLFGITTATGSTLLMWLHVISPVVAFIGVLLGCAAAFYSFSTNRKKSKAADLELQLRQNQLSDFNRTHKV